MVSKEGEQSTENPIVEVIPLRGWRKILADRMLHSHLDLAEVTQMREIDATEMVNLRKSIVDSLQEKYGVRITYTHLLMKAAAEAIKQHPIMNSTLAEDEIRVLQDINISMAVSVPGGALLTPVIRQVGRKSLVEVAKEAATMAEQIRTRKFNLDILKGGTFTLTNAGMYGTDFVTSLIPIPQIASLAVGRLVPKPVVRDGQIVIRTMMGLSVTYDHRVVTGAFVAQFFQTIEENVENISKLDMGI